MIHCNIFLQLPGGLAGMGGLGQRTVVVNKPASSAMATQQAGQKVIIMTSRPPTPSQVSLVIQVWCFCLILCFIVL